MAKAQIGRRQFLALSCGAALASLAETKFAFAAGAPEGPALVIVNLRGGMDGLATVVPYGDPNYAGTRRGLALAAPGQDKGITDLDGFFGLHPALGFCGQCHAKGEMLAVVGAASPYRERSHFDAQDVLANGTAEPKGRSGWLNRALPFTDPGNGAVAVGSLVPLLLRGKAPVSSWIPPVTEEPDENFLALMDRLYATDPLLGKVWQQSRDRNFRQTASGGRNENSFEQACGIAAEMMSGEAGPRVVSLELSGWDTHAGQGAENGRLARQFTLLDSGLERLAVGIGEERWRRTAVLVVSEFGRTVRMNGTGGTDHGTGGAALLLGGAVQGGRVVNDWRGLDDKNLYENRDLYPSIDLRSMFKAVLHDHMKVNRKALERDVFPDSQAAKPLPDLIRA